MERLLESRNAPIRPPAATNKQILGETLLYICYTQVKDADPPRPLQVISKLVSLRCPHPWAGICYAIDPCAGDSLRGRGSRCRWPVYLILVFCCTLRGFPLASVHAAQETKG